MDSIELKLCEIQGHLFELAAESGLDGENFVSFFMNSEAAKHLDSVYNKLQWMGEEYLLEEILDGSDGCLSKAYKKESGDLMFWAGYIYRYWHYYKKEKSSRIYKLADFKVLKRNYLMFHTMDPEIAIDDFIEMHEQNKYINKRKRHN